MVSAFLLSIRRAWSNPDRSRRTRTDFPPVDMSRVSQSFRKIHPRPKDFQGRAEENCHEDEKRHHFVFMLGREKTPPRPPHRRRNDISSLV
jgi:hypothetical protein